MFEAISRWFRSLLDTERTEAVSSRPPDRERRPMPSPGEPARAVSAVGSEMPVAQRMDNKIRPHNSEVIEAVVADPLGEEASELEPSDLPEKKPRRPRKKKTE